MSGRGMMRERVEVKCTATPSTDTSGVPRDTHRVSGLVSVRTPLPAERGKSVRWNRHLYEQLCTCIKSKAEARGLRDSLMVEELL
jgi:hypothetical protein